ncbi:MAG TPA: RNA polymerase sigma factor [Miltoncostaeaceae bacterium]|nr:RNA polymerase sigma factor [Miltoncostaeaceae bacterium]
MSQITPTDTGTSDAELVRRYLDGEIAAGEVLFGRHWPRSWRAAYAVAGSATAADDATQAAVERAIRGLDGFNIARPFGPWLARIAVNQALNNLRVARREVPLVDEHQSADLYGEVDNRDEVIHAVAALPADQRVVVALRYWADMSREEIAAVTDTPLGTVASRLSRALTTLRTNLGEVSL